MTGLLRNPLAWALALLLACALAASAVATTLQ